MTDSFLRLHPNGPQWPYTVAKFRADEPQLSISDNPHDAELATYAILDPPIFVFRVILTEQPSYNLRTEKVEETTPAFIDNKWRQQWRIRAATAEEIAAYDLANLPPPNWDLFEALAIRDPSFDAILGLGLQPGVAPAASVTLGDSMREIKVRGEVAIPSFRNSWTRLCRKVNAPQEEIQRFAGAASACNLPEYFIQAILAPIPED